MIYCKSELGASQIKCLTKRTDTCEYTYIKIAKSKHNEEIYIGVYYRHCLHNKQDITNFINEFENSLDTNLLRKRKLVVTGDFNLDLCKVTVNTDIINYFNCLISNNLECHILKPTRIEYYKNSLQVRSATLIDHVCSNLLELNCTAGNLYYSDSDHFANFVIFDDFFVKMQKTQQKDNIPTMRLFNKVNNDSLLHDINSIDWFDKVCNDELDLNSCTTNLIENIQVLYDKHMPEVKCSKRKAKYCYKPWIDKELLVLIKIKISYSVRKKVSS